MIASCTAFKGIDERLELADSFSTAVYAEDFRVNSASSLELRGQIISLGGVFSQIEGVWAGVYKGSELALFSAGGGLYKITDLTRYNAPEKLCDIGVGEMQAFEFGGSIYIKNSRFYGRYDGNTVTAVTGYIPLVAISCAPTGEGEVFEEINLICDKRRQQFSGDGASVLYYLAEEGIDEIVSITVDGKPYSYEYALDEGRAVSIQQPFPKGLNNVEIVYRKKNAESDRERILNCRRVMLFGGNSDGRVFLYGNDDFPNYRFHSSLASGIPSAEYFPINAFTVIGKTKINCIVQQYDKQLIFASDQAYYSYCELREDGLGNIYSSFPVFSLNGSKGCIIETDSCIIDNRPVTLCDDGLNIWESTSVVNEKNARCFSMPIEKTLKAARLIKGTSYSLCDLQANRELFFIIDDSAFVYNYGNDCWYRFKGFGGNYFRAVGDKLIFARGAELFAYSEQFARTDCGVWKSGFIKAWQNDSGVDIRSVDLDVYAENCYLHLYFERANGERIDREARFSVEEGGFRRIRLRLGFRRAMPFRIVLEASGGKILLHSISINLRKKERSLRNGIL